MRPSWPEVRAGAAGSSTSAARAPWRSDDLRDLIEFTGRAAASIGSLLLRPAGFRPAAIAHHIVETGVRALPIVGLLAVMISIVIAYQGVAQLRPYGGQDLTIDLVAVSVLREMAVLITAILVAGRSGAAFAAEIGVMQSNEEIDALTIMGLDPMELLVAPRLIALVLALFALTFFADLMGLLGGAAISQMLLDVAPGQYLLRVRDAVDSSDLFAGLVKAPVFAVVIAVTGCMHGLRVEGSAESVGSETTRAVVKSIFLVIVLDAMFSILLREGGDMTDAHASDIALSARGIVNRFGNQTVHDGLDLDVESGEVLGIGGASGSGKSVLLRTLCGLLRPQAGAMLAGGRPVGELAARRASRLLRHAVSARGAVLLADGRRERHAADARAHTARSRRTGKSSRQ